MTMQVIAIALGGAVGSVLRFLLSGWTHTLLGRGFPYGTLAVNVIGCALMGFLFVLFLERLSVGSAVRAGLLIGVLGGFTTFSSFSVETFNLIESTEWLKAGVNVVASLLLCLMATWAGVVLGRAL